MCIDGQTIDNNTIKISVVVNTMENQCYESACTFKEMLLIQKKIYIYCRIKT